MKKKVLVSLVLLSMIGTSVVFAQVQASRVPRNLTQAREMVAIRGGTFTMRIGGDRITSVQVQPFLIRKYEVTQEDFMDVLGNPFQSSITGRTSYVPGNTGGGWLPTECVSWYDALDYCNALSRKEGLTPVYSITKTGSGARERITVRWDRNANGYRLPTEAEWEYACRAGTTTLFNTGNRISLEQANYDGRKGFLGTAFPLTNRNAPTTRNVGSYESNQWGLYDMHGNVMEWCWDWYSSNFYSSSGTKSDPVGPDRQPSDETGIPGDMRIFRGGSYSNGEGDLASAERYRGVPDIRHTLTESGDMIGFRVVRNDPSARYTSPAVINHTITR
jgi:formylglycine-generating enzyme required for sulfatase activity